MKKAKISLSVFYMLFLIIGCSAKQVRESESLAICNSIAISPDGQYIAAGRNIFNIIFLYESKSHKIVKYFRGREDDIWGCLYARSIGFSPDVEYLAAAGIDGIVCKWDVSTGEKIYSLSNEQT